jgi:hypothetical protein
MRFPERLHPAHQANVLLPGVEILRGHHYVAHLSFPFRDVIDRLLART